MASIPPNQTLYVRNLNDKIRKDVLRRTLYEVCIDYGRILDIVALKTMKMRGQAFIVFENISTATAALRHLNGREVLGRAMHVEYALSKSDAAAQRDGTFAYGEERAHVSAAERKRLLGIAGRDSGTTAKRRADADDNAEEGEKDEQGSNGHLAKRQAVGEESFPDAEDSGSDSDSSDVGPMPPPPASVGADRERVGHTAADDQRMPNPTLFVSNIPEGVSMEMLRGLFQQYAGFKEVRLVAGKGGVAFVDYESVDSASAAREVLDGFVLSADKSMTVDFSR
ncbi:hypothetical protein H4217_006021 [Coemansia sp. RSA 1939]|nr:hypothetical protein H4217_006021 [Coemansia sp. RSA 1939]KAJ2644243.1 hypothetical protein GGH99_008427 [Coemansia sp. RSA 1285]